MKAQHTPGPWEVEQDEGTGQQVVVYQSRDICRVNNQPGHEDGPANSRLIALAPQMFDALLAMLEARKKSTDEMRRLSYRKEIQSVFDEVEAIAKAE